MRDFVYEEESLDSPTFDELLEAMIKWKARTDFTGLAISATEGYEGDGSTYYLIATRKKTDEEKAAEAKARDEKQAAANMTEYEKAKKTIADCKKEIAALEKIVTAFEVFKE